MANSNKREKAELLIQRPLKVPLCLAKMLLRTDLEFDRALPGDRLATGPHQPWPYNRTTKHKHAFALQRYNIANRNTDETRKLMNDTAMFWRAASWRTRTHEFRVP